MPKFDFESPLTGDVKVSGRSTALPSPVTLPAGPRTFPPTPPPPTPPPIPTFTQNMNLGIAWAVLFTDQDTTLVGTPAIIADPGGTPFVCTTAQQLAPRIIVLEFAGVSFQFATTVQVPANDTAITNADGTPLVAGDYTVFQVS